MILQQLPAHQNVEIIRTLAILTLALDLAMGLALVTRARAPAHQNVEIIRTQMISELSPLSGSVDLFIFSRLSTVTLAKPG